MVLERNVWYQLLVVKQSRRWVSDQLLLVFCAGRDLLRSFEESDLGKSELEILGAVLEFLSSLVGRAFWNPGFTAGRGFNPAGGAPGGG
ncbi:hypothetical protein F511_35783 [Dorcoceras hygrometricum]|uniref:Uncharacterized protein n=1 Tax=Dorcoceras hygrometricum TaxID=472368 RepID=A0A2Z7C107_9LAMI|nr:hypothetical protein F511_35783 [Dorcoceras hygrometricum]